ncbi:MAG: WYL domain-containing protein [Acidimicrobiaceae bacterium]|nr:WYL domain-containing protein [Acidimicrobiaceae bacterium]
MDKLERLLNLTAALRDCQQPLSARELRRRMAGAYSEDDVAFRRMFERDKADLRAIGVPIEVTTLHRFDPPVDGYSIADADYTSRDQRFDPDELAVLHLATNLVRVEGAGEGLARLGGGFGGAADGPGSGLEPQDVPAAAAQTVGELPFHQALSKLVAAAIRRRAVSFVYRDEQRQVEPWRLSFHRGRWYLAGWDRRQSSERLYRVDRISGGVADAGPAARPAGTGPDLRSLKPWEYGEGDPVAARQLVDADQAAWACHRAGRQGERQLDGSVVLTLSVRDSSALRAFVLEFLEHAELLEPEWLRTEIADWLEALVEPEAL